MFDPLLETVEAFDRPADMQDSDDAIWAVEKELRALDAAELHLHRDAVNEAKTKELKSWVDHKTGHPVAAREYGRRTGLRPLPSRWLVEWKMKEGVKVIKARLVLKGFAEEHQQQLFTSAPTATRISHRLVVLVCTVSKWFLWSLDVSTAFLQGFTFEQLRTAGYERQPVAFKAPAGTLELLAALSPVFGGFAKLEEPVVEVLKGAYGLKDAPLLWNLALCSRSTAATSGLPMILAFGSKHTQGACPS